MATKKLSLKTAAIVTIHSPGSMTKKGRKSIADWLRRTACDLEKLGDQYTDKTFRGRFLY